MKNRANWMLATVPLVFLLALLVAPALRLLIEGGQLSVWEPLLDSYLRWRLGWSFLQAALTCALALGLGLPVAWVLARFEFAGRSVVLHALMLPFVVPTLVAAMGVLSLMGPQGVLRALGGPDLQGSPWLLIYGNLFFNLCLVVRAATEALGQVSASRVAAARTLGAAPWRVFWRIEWPSTLPWLMSALCLVFLYCFSGFGLALLLGGQEYATVEVEIYTLVAHELQLAQAGSLALWALALTSVVALAYAVIERHLSTPARADIVTRRRPQGWRQWVGVWAALVVLALFCAAPLLAIVWRAVAVGGPAWSVLIDATTLTALWNSLRFTVLAVALATGLGLAHALAARRSLLLRTLAFLPFVVSPVMVAFGLLLLYPQWTASFGLLVCAYALLAYPFVAKSLAAGLDSVPVHLMQAARTLGATPWHVFLRVTLPLLRPALRRGMAFAAATAVGEFAATLFLSRPEWATLTTLVYEYMGRPGTANSDAALVLACLLMALALLAFALIEWSAPASPPQRRSSASVAVGHPAREFRRA
jgi:thiamine transport system permease protein